MNTQTYRVNRPDVIDEHFDDEYVLVNLRTGTYYSLNRPAADIWDFLNQNMPHAAILAQMEQQYAADAERLATDLNSLLAEMVSEQLIIPNTVTPNSVVPNSVAATLEPNPGERRAYLAPQIEKFTDMQALLLLDPIHQVDESGWPMTKPDAR